VTKAYEDPLSNTKIRLLTKQQWDLLIFHVEILFLIKKGRDQIMEYRPFTIYYNITYLEFTE